MRPELVMLAGPNGAGKSTFYDTFLSGSPLQFLNADVLAARTSIDSFHAARVLDAARERMVERRESFVTETVFSDPDGKKLQFLVDAQDAGYDVSLIFVGLAPEVQAHRVDQSVARGGHDVPREKLQPRFLRSLTNLANSIPVLETVEVYDNSSDAQPYRLLATFERGVMVWRTADPVPAWARGIIPKARKPARKAPKGG